MTAGAWIAVAAGVWLVVSFACCVLVGKAMALCSCRQCGEPLGRDGCVHCFDSEAREEAVSG